MLTHNANTVGTRGLYFWACLRDAKGIKLFWDFYYRYVKWTEGRGFSRYVLLSLAFFLTYTVCVCKPRVGCWPGYSAMYLHTCNMSQICLLLGRLTTRRRAMHHCCQFTEISAKLFLRRGFCQSASRKVRLFLYLKRSQNSTKLWLFFSATVRWLNLIFLLNLGFLFVHIYLVFPKIRTKI